MERMKAAMTAADNYILSNLKVLRCLKRKKKIYLDSNFVQLKTSLKLIMYLKEKDKCNGVTMFRKSLTYLN
ncbi:CLUMA_CG000311, isoform A [Clunio marinus]|uniref:CLUMA_CG000311, isoform A n=1 Tax=Clunio marinus TaxID=568069 RepID=A0A1J1HEK0_9DIPT|nr:CLUMA_CG000311, isoform A [Clunio marinus]